MPVLEGKEMSAVLRHAGSANPDKPGSMPVADLRTAAGAQPFLWRDRTGFFHRADEMHTRHLFYTLRMIWNNTMPEQCRLPGNLYVFGPSYSRAYLISAIRPLALELSKRKDMTEEWKLQLQKMIAWLATGQLPHTSAPDRPRLGAT